MNGSFKFVVSVFLVASVGSFVACAEPIQHAGTASADNIRLKDRVTSEKLRPAASFSDKQYKTHIDNLKKSLPDDEQFHVFLQKPFVVIGNESAELVKQRCSGTVKWAVDRIKKQYFKNDPNKIINIWLFKDKETYEKYNLQLFGSKPHTPFGYYSSSKKVLVMNINTGGGTLVHEIVHPFMESNFKDCPSWFNEGLASLYEQSRSKDGKIWGSTNWRLRGLQLAIESDRVPSFKELCSTTERQFYDEDPGTNYAQARYLCYFLQENGLLQDFFNGFMDNVESDPSGYKTLVKVLGELDNEQFTTDHVVDMASFKKAWEGYVMKLTFP